MLVLDGSSAGIPPQREHGFRGCIWEGSLGETSGLRGTVALGVVALSNHCTLPLLSGPDAAPSPASRSRRSSQSGTVPFAGSCFRSSSLHGPRGERGGCGRPHGIHPGAHAPFCLAPVPSARFRPYRNPPAMCFSSKGAAVLSQPCMMLDSWEPYFAMRSSAATANVANPTDVNTPPRTISAQTKRSPAAGGAR